jgi:uncharacterized protein YutE (UPF0331/DUF86 family)
MIDDVILNKVESIERCIRQIRLYEKIPSEVAFQEDYYKQDAILLNLQRAIELCIDVANHIVRMKKIGIPKESRDAIQLLIERHIISESTGIGMKGMIGFRNIAIHEYQKVDTKIFRSIIDNRLDDFTRFTSEIIRSMSNNESMRG